MKTGAMIERDNGGLPTDNWLIAASDEEVTAWVIARAAGCDGVWNSRGGDDPADGIQVLLTNRAHDVKVKLIYALSAALDKCIDESSCDGEIVERLLDLAATVGFLPPNHGSRCLVNCIERKIRIKPELRPSLLRARSELAPAPEHSLWDEFLKDPNCRFEAFRCARRSRFDIAIAAFEKLVRGGVEIIDPVLRQQLSLLQAEVPQKALHDSLRRLSGDAGTTGRVGRALTRLAFPEPAINDARAAFVKAQEPLLNAPGPTGNSPATTR